jgi:hypothetical protein
MVDSLLLKAEVHRKKLLNITIREQKSVGDKRDE